MRKLSWSILAALCLVIGAYPIRYLVAQGKFGLLQLKTDSLLHSAGWRWGFYTHIVSGGVALFVGWAQFIKSWRTRSPRLHRNLGKLYVAMVGFSGVAGLGLAFFASTGWVAGLGFGTLALVWLGCTFQAYRCVRQRDLRSHERWMIYSYSACFAAVTLRVWLPILLGVLRLDFAVAYPIVAWLCWVPNLFVACWLNYRIQQTA